MTEKLTMPPSTQYVTPPRVILKGVPRGFELSALSVIAHMILWNGHEFEAVYADAWRQEPFPPYNIIPRVDPYDDLYEQRMLMYYPIDPRMTLYDVRGATIAYPNETNTGWLFAHCDADAMIDYEKELAAAVVGEFAEAIDGAQVKVNEATNATVRAQAVGNHAALVEYRDAVVENVVTWCRTLFIGWQEQNPHDAHVHFPVLRAIQAVATAWQADRPTDYSKVNAKVAGIIKGLARPHAYETRWDMSFRLADQRRAEAARGDDPVEHNEYCYTIVVPGRAIAGPENFPDDNWTFDQLRNGPIVRGDYTYTDAEPAATDVALTVVRSRRLIPKGLKPGERLPYSNWIQEPAYTIPPATPPSTPSS